MTDVAVGQLAPSFRLQSGQGPEIGPQYTYGSEVRWGAPTYTAIHNILTSPVYAGAYVYGKTRHERVLDQQGKIKKRSRRLPPRNGQF